MKIAIIGAGPRGLMLLHQLSKNITTETQIDLYDTFQPGGRVWRIDQPLYYLMNSTAQLITLFNDYKNNSLTGPTFYQWSKSDDAKDFIEAQNYQTEFKKLCQNLKPNDFAPRALFGVYANWFYHKIIKEAPTNLNIKFINQAVNSANKIEKQQYELRTDSTCKIYDFVIASTGTSDNQLTNDEKSLANYAAKYNLTYLAPSYANETDLTNLDAGKTVLLRGMGLNFFDYLTMFTIGRGGKFTTDESDNLTYHPSGKEPQLIAGSRRGVPYYPKPKNELPLSEQLPLVFMNHKNIQANLVNQKLPYTKFFELFKAEIENRYYQLLINNKYPNLDAKTFSHDFQTSKDRKATIAKYHFKEDDLLDWSLIANPVAGVPITNTDAYQQVLLQWIKLISEDAQLGSLHAPLTGSLSLFVEMRDLIQQLVAEHYFTNDDYINNFLKKFNPLASFLTAGPPVIRFQQLQAIMKAGILKIVPPQLQVMGANHHFIARSHFYPGEIFTCDALIEARLPKANFSLTNNKFINSLKDSKTFTPYFLKLNDGDSFNTQAINVNESTFNPLDEHKNSSSNIFIWGLPLTGLEWMTTALPHALSDDRNFFIINQITKQIINS